MSTTYRKKLIEVALPLPEINDASAFDKRPGIGPHPKSLHHWWARLPLPTARAVLFASMVDDPSEHPEKWASEEEQTAERERLFTIVRALMSKKSHEQPHFYDAARREVASHCEGKLPVLFDPFAGGGSIPLEAARLGLVSHAADLNPVAVLLNRCNLALAPRWADHAPVNAGDRVETAKTSWRGLEGLGADVRHYGDVVLERARKKISTLYPGARLPQELGGGEAKVIAWIWARTVASPNPALGGVHVPLLSTMVLSNKPGNSALIELVLRPETSERWTTRVRTGKITEEELARGSLGTKAGKAQAFRCALTGDPIQRSYIQAEGKAGRLGCRLVAIIADGGRGRVFLSPTAEHESVGKAADSRADEARESFLAGPLPTRAEITGGVCTAYGLSTWGHLFQTRQLVALLTFSDLVRDVADDVRRDASGAGLTAAESDSYTTAVVTFLALALDRCVDSNNTLCRWDKSAAGQRVKNLFGRQAIPMVFDFAEANVLGDKSVCWKSAVSLTAEAVESLVGIGARLHSVLPLDAATGAREVGPLLVSTDPPYYDNISYARLSDLFYVWLRRTIGNVHPDLFGTVLTPKGAELIAAPDRFGGSREAAREHFESGFKNAFGSLRGQLDPRFPMTVYYAFKQDDEQVKSDEADEEERPVDLTTGWDIAVSRSTRQPPRG